MNLYAFMWINMNSCVFMNINEFIWIKIILPWIYVNWCEFRWIYMDLSELIWIYVNSFEFKWIKIISFEYIRMYVNLCECGHGWQCAVCSSAGGSVRQCVAVRQYVGLYVAMFGSKHGSVRAMCAVRPVVCCSAIGSVRQCVAVCGRASTRRSRCVAVRSTCNIHKVAHNIYSLTEAVGMSLIFLAYL
jgi:hypothetical protein